MECAFEYNYVNNAWGLKHAGKIIDFDGKIYAYELPTLKDECLRCKINKGKLIGQLTLDEQRELCKMASHMTNKTIKNMLSIFDAGTHSYKAYILTDHLRTVTLYQFGREELHNVDSKATILVERLKAIFSM